MHIQSLESTGFTIFCHVCKDGCIDVRVWNTILLNLSMRNLWFLQQKQTQILYLKFVLVPDWKKKIGFQIIYILLPNKSSELAFMWHNKFNIV